MQTRTSSIAASALLRGGLRLLEGGRHRNPGDGEMFAERGVEVLRDLARRPAALLVHRGERLRRLEERVGVSTTAEHLAVHVARLLGAEEGDDRSVQIRVH